MTDTGIPTVESDVEALMLGDTFAGEDEPCITDAVGREVTMRGDLQQMQLGDVFQSLGMSKMEGILRLRNAVETREIYFRDGTVRAYITERAEMRRIGVQLVQGGLIAPEALRAIVLMLCPIVPHICHALWTPLGGEGDILNARWPEADDSALARDTIEMVVQVKGKVRGKIAVPADASDATIQAAALAQDNVGRFVAELGDYAVKVVPGKLISFFAKK